MKLTWILSIILPMLDTAAMILEQRDENSTGADDNAAKALRAASAALREYLK